MWHLSCINAYLEGLPHNDVVPRLKEKVMAFKQVMPVITSLRNPSLKQRHYEQIETVIGRAILREKGFTLGNLLDMNVTRIYTQAHESLITL